MQHKIVTRFAPSPTGFLHIGGARTALFNWLYARHNHGIFRLRIEDTDQQRSTPDAVQAILDGLEWLGLHWDDKIVYQSERFSRHREIVNTLVNAGHAYGCYCSPDELIAMRELAVQHGRSPRYDGRCRHLPIPPEKKLFPPAIRLAAPEMGVITIHDQVQGQVQVHADQLDDMVLLRSDGTPTYMLSVVVDDHDMEVTHIIRGDDHLTNAFRQTLIYQMLGWNIPNFAHIPLIHGPDGTKLSKRHGAVGIDAYRQMGYLPTALRNYLARLGWAHGDDEIFSTEQAVAWFDLAQIGQSPSRIDFAKMGFINAHYLRQESPETLLTRVSEILQQRLGRTYFNTEENRFLAAIPLILPRVQTLVDLANQLFIFSESPTLDIEHDAKTVLQKSESQQVLSVVLSQLDNVIDWNIEGIKTWTQQLISTQGWKTPQLGIPLRAALAGRLSAMGFNELLSLLGHDLVKKRIMMNLVS